jgi:hypothetical protein
VDASAGRSPSVSAFAPLPRPSVYMI